MKVLIIIPAYNEQDSILNVVNSIYGLYDNIDVVVINDGSKDNTLIEAYKTKATVIDLPCNLGIGGAMQTGYLYASKNNYDIAIVLGGTKKPLLQQNSDRIKEYFSSIKNEVFVFFRSESERV